MILVLNKNQEFNDELAKVMVNVQTTDDILDLQIKLSEDGAEYDLLLIDLDLTSNQTDILIKWIIKHNPFIKRIILYYDENIPSVLSPNNIDNYMKWLKKAQYKVNSMPFTQLYDGLLRYENE